MADMFGPDGFGQAGDGLSPYGIRHLIKEQMLPFMSYQQLQRLKDDIEEVEEAVRLAERPWYREGQTADDVLTLEEKVVLLGIPCKENEYTNTRDYEGKISTQPRKIQAIKMARSRLGYGLKQAKWLCDEYEAGLKAGQFIPPTGTPIDTDVLGYDEPFPNLEDEVFS
jgi:ribosomal protein L7/L12